MAANDPQRRTESAQIAARARWAPTAPARLEAAIQRAVNAMPPVDEETRNRLAAILGIVVPPTNDQLTALIHDD